MNSMNRTSFALDSVESTTALLEKYNYIPDIGLSTSLFLAQKMGKAIFLEGEPGVGPRRQQGTPIQLSRQPRLLRGVPGIRGGAHQRWHPAGRRHPN